MNFAQKFYELLLEYVGNYLQRHFYSSPGYKQLEKTGREVLSLIQRNLPQGKEKLLQLYEEQICNVESTELSTASFMAGLCFAFELFKLCCNPQEIIFPEWDSSNEAWQAVVEEAYKIAGQ